MADKIQTKQTITYGHATDRGLKRPDNQDCYGKFPEQCFDLTDEKGQLFIVADGMGGLAAGREASETAVQTIQMIYFSDENRAIPDSLKHAFKVANSEIYARAQTLFAQSKMGTTCTALVLTEKLAHIAHVGDSRAYHITKNNIKQLTSDHTYVAEMQRKKILTRQQAQNHVERSVLYRALGIDPSVAVEIIPKIALHPGDYFLLHTDGLNRVTPKEIQRIVLANPPQQACEQLIQLANERGGEDNSTVQIIQINPNGKQSSIVASIKMSQAIFSLKWLVIGLCLFVIIICSWYLLKDSLLKSSRPSTEAQQSKRQYPEAKYDSAFALNIKDKSTLSRLDDASHFLDSGDLDSAMAIYQIILKLDPMHIGAIDGMNRLVNEYKKQADYFRSRDYFAEALRFYKKLELLLPKDQSIKNLISLCEFKLQEAPAKQELQADDATNDDSAIVEPAAIADQLKLTGVDTVLGFQISDWDFTGLGQPDYELEPGGLIFHNNPAAKRIIYPTELRDIEVEVLAQNHSSGAHGEYGIIFGYGLSDRIAQEAFFLYALNETGDLLLKKISQGQEMLLFSRSKDDLLFESRITKLKVRCLGPYIMIYGEGRLIKAWNEEKFIIGKVGLFADPYLQVEFSQFKITPLVLHSVR